MKRVIAMFPRFEYMDGIEELREKFDPLFPKVAPHITLVAPFESDISSEQLRLHIQRVVDDTAPFRITLRGVTGHEGEYLFLNVKRGNDQLIQLRDRLYSDFLAPHLLRQYTYIPHLTVGRLPNQPSFLGALETAIVLQMPFETLITDIFVYNVLPDGSRPVELSISL